MDVPALDPENAKRLIAGLDHLNLEHQTVDGLKEQITPLFAGYRTYIRTFQPGLSVYRAVKWPAPPVHIGKLSYAPREIVGASRANRSNQPLFYGALASRNASLFELRLVAGDRIATGQWETTKPLQVAQLGHVDSVFQKLNAFRKPYFKWDERDPGSGVVDQWLAGRFCERVLNGEGHKYKLTTAIAEKYLDAELFDGLVYPSIETRGNADNLALKAGAADAKLTL